MQNIMAGYEVKIITTEDGSPTLFVPRLNETYHSTHGAITESRYVFIKQGLEHKVEFSKITGIRILEIGFGTGLNALLTVEFCKKHPEINVEYITIEPFPLSEDVIDKLNYYERLEFSKVIWNELHQSPWNEPVLLIPNFSLFKVKSNIEDYSTDKSFHLVYFDAFAPGKQPEIWEKKVFEKIFNLMNDGAVLTTYCAQGEFKRTLKSCGFVVESLPGPPGKKEMVRAGKS